MPLKLVSSVPEDVHRFVDIYFAAFRSPTALACFPDSPATRKWWVAKLQKDLEEAPGHFMKIIEVKSESESAGEALAFARWDPPHSQTEADDKNELQDLPEGGDHALAKELFSQTASKHREIMKTEPHWCKSSPPSTPCLHVRTAHTFSRPRYRCDSTRAPGKRCRIDADISRMCQSRRDGTQVLLASVHCRLVHLPSARLRRAREDQL